MMIQQSPSVFVELAVNVAMVFGSPCPGNVFQPVDREETANWLKLRNYQHP